MSINQRCSLICRPNHLTGFYIMATLAFNELIGNKKALSKIFYALYLLLSEDMEPGT